MAATRCSVVPAQMAQIAGTPLPTTPTSNDDVTDGAAEIRLHTSTLAIRPGSCSIGQDPACPPTRAGVPPDPSQVAPNRASSSERLSSQVTTGRSTEPPGRVGDRTDRRFRVPAAQTHPDLAASRCRLEPVGAATSAPDTGPRRVAYGGERRIGGAPHTDGLTRNDSVLSSRRICPA